MKKFLISLFSILFLLTATVTGGVLLYETHFEDAGGGFRKMKMKMQAN